MRNLDAPAPAHFDDTLGAWVLSRYDDVAAALRDPRFMMPGTAEQFDATHVAVRDAATAEFASDRLSRWRPRLAANAREFVEALATDRPVDLVRDFARPWSLRLACLIAGLGDGPAIDATDERATRADALARVIFVSAATSTDGSVSALAHEAAGALAQLLTEHGRGDPHAASVQTFVAVSHTLPALLTGAWHALLSDPPQVALLRETSGVMPTAIGELLRLGSPSRALFREAAVNVTVGHATVRAGDAVVLMVATANRDDARFPVPHRLDVHRDSAGHLAFGAGAHRCVGTSLVRLAVDVATRALLDGTQLITLVEPHDAPDENGMPFAIASPEALWVMVRRAITSSEIPA